jgi:hypothetical protein
VPEDSKVRIRYPVDGQDADEAWLEAVASRHHGTLSEARMLSCPVQRIAAFRSPSSAEAFVDELTSSGRWKASIA